MSEAADEIAQAIDVGSLMVLWFRLWIRLLLCVDLTPDAFVFDKLLSALRRFCKAKSTGALAQLGEHLLCKQGVIGSIPISSTIFGGLADLSWSLSRPGVPNCLVRLTHTLSFGENTNCTWLRSCACSDTS